MAHEQAKFESVAAQGATQDIDTRAQWRAKLDAHGAEHGFHLALGDRHGVLYTADDRTLIVSFENAENLRTTQTGLPLGLSVAGREGWSSLAVYSEGETWFRDPAVYGLFDTLSEESFFDDFDRVLFCGAGAGGYAAAAYSVVAPGAHLLLIRPQATLDPRLTEWDARFPEMRRADWHSRYGYAPAQAEAAESGTIVYDPNNREDAMHAALFTREGFQKLRTPHLGARIERDLDAMGILMPMIRLAGKGHLSPHRFAKLYRRRRGHVPYLRRVLSTLDDLDRPFLTGLWARGVLRDQKGPRFRKALKHAEAALQKHGRALPEALEARD
jgi:hypothetical protein